MRRCGPSSWAVLGFPGWPVCPGAPLWTRRDWRAALLNLRAGTGDNRHLSFMVYTDNMSCFRIGPPRPEQRWAINQRRFLLLLKNWYVPTSQRGMSVQILLILTCLLSMVLEYKFHACCICCQIKSSIITCCDVLTVCVTDYKLHLSINIYSIYIFFNSREL